jgi:hypothetical protein
MFYGSKKFILLMPWIGMMKSKSIYRLWKTEDKKTVFINIGAAEDLSPTKDIIHSLPHI